MPRSGVISPFPIRRWCHGREHQHERDDAPPFVVLRYEAVGGLVTLFGCQMCGFGLLRRHGQMLQYRDMCASEPALGAPVTTPSGRLVRRGTLIHRGLSRGLPASFRPDAFPFKLALTPPNRVGQAKYFDVP